MALVNHFMSKCNKDLREKVTERIRTGVWDEEGVSTLDRYKAAIRIRLNMNAPYVLGDRWHEAMAVGALPGNAIKTAGYLNELTAIICEAGKSGGGGEGGNFNPVAEYGERAAVGAVYLSTEVRRTAQGPQPHFNATHPPFLPFPQLPPPLPVSFSCSLTNPPTLLVRGPS